MAYGHMAAFMKDNEEGLDSPAVQIRGMANFGLRGAEGVMLLTSKDEQLRFAHLFACPYFEGNGTYIGFPEQGQDIKSLCTDYYGKRKVSVDYTDKGYRLRANVNDARGGVVACIASIAR